MSDGVQVIRLGEAPDVARLRELIRQNAGMIRDDAELMSELGLKPDDAKVVEFGPAALAKVSAEAKAHSTARKQLEQTARANFAAQAQTHAAAIDILDARNHADLARRLDELAIHRFGLVGAMVAVEGPGRTPAGWYGLIEGQVDLILGPRKQSRMGFHAPAAPLFGAKGAEVKSMAMIRMSVWEPGRQGILAFGSPDAEAFHPKMGAELVAFLARVFERTAERWPVL